MTHLHGVGRTYDGLDVMHVYLQLHCREIHRAGVWMVSDACVDSCQLEDNEQSFAHARVYLLS
jgi:hypothetical protein